MNKALAHNRYTYPAGIILFGLVCCISLFAVSSSFVSRELASKWFGLMLCVSFAGIVWNVWYKNVYVSIHPVLLLLAVCLFLVPIRDWYTSGFNPEWVTYCGCLLFILYLFIQITKAYPAVYLSGIMVALAAGMAVYGLLQYAGIFRSFNTNFSVTGSFDNPAGYASALCFTLPYAVYLIRKTPGTIKYIPVAASVAILAGIVLSGSRAAITACLVVGVCYLCSRFSGIKLKKWMPVAFITVCIVSVTILYFLKKDSADGRLLIWQCTWNMIKDQPVAGHGLGAFRAEYMLYQADYFEKYPDSKYAALADNVLHPFNEYLLVGSEHGIIGLCALALLGFLLLRSYRRSPDFLKFIAGLSLLAVVVFSCFSYPFRYPFTWLMAIWNMVLLCADTGLKTVAGKRSHAVKTGITAFLFVLLYTAIPLIGAEMKWNKTAEKALAGKTSEMLPEYGNLYQQLGKNGLFLYNHAAELNHAGKYKESLRVFNQCTRYYNDMDVQILMADNYKALKQYDKAERHLKLAANMCPGRFMPLYELVKLYDRTGEKGKAQVLARKIVDKEVKVPSPTVTAIKREMESLIQTSENISPME